MGKIKKRFWTSWCNTKSTDIRRSRGGFGRRISKLGKALKWKIYYFIGFSAQASTLGISSYLNNTFQTWDPPTFRGFFGLIFPTKSREMSPISGSSPVFVSKPLAAQTF